MNESFGQILIIKIWIDELNAPTLSVLVAYIIFLWVLAVLGAMQQVKVWS